MSKRLLPLDGVAIGTLEQVRPGESRPCVGCQRPVYCGDPRSQRIPAWACIYCMLKAVMAHQDEPWMVVVPEGMTVQQFVAALLSGQLPHRN